MLLCLKPVTILVLVSGQKNLTNLFSFSFLLPDGRKPPRQLETRNPQEKKILMIFIFICSSSHSNNFISFYKNVLDTAVESGKLLKWIVHFILRSICSLHCTMLLRPRGHFGPPGRSRSVCSWWWRLSDGSGQSDPPAAPTLQTRTDWLQSGPASCGGQTLQRAEKKCLKKKYLFFLYWLNRIAGCTDMNKHCPFFFWLAEMWSLFCSIE